MFLFRFRTRVLLLVSFQLFHNIIFAQVNLSSSNLPLVFIYTNGQTIVDEPKINGKMEIIYNGVGKRNSITDPPSHFSGNIGIEIRGNSSQYLFPMKSYTIELRDAAGAGEAHALLGMPAEPDWVLYAPYTDKTLMRNFMAYAMSRDQGHWASNGRFVELILDGEYRGIYLLEEKIKRDDNRVNIAKLTNTDLVGDALTGGYIFSLDHRPNGWVSKYPTENGTANKVYRTFSYVYPKLEDIMPVQKAYLQTIVDRFETALAAPDFEDPVKGFRKYADENSFIDYLIINEVTRNVDAYRLSSYFHKNKDSKNPKIVAGPVWDYDLAFRNAEYCFGDKMIGWAYDFNYICTGDWAQIPFWWSRLLQDEEFVKNLWCRWTYLRKTVLATNTLFKRIDSVASVLNEAKDRHFKRWPILGNYVWPNPQPFAKTYEEEVYNLKQWLSGRLFWMDDNFLNKGECVNNEISTIVEIMISPNPISSEAKIDFLFSNIASYDLKVMDVLGRVQYKTTGVGNIGNNSITIPARGWPKGIFYVSLTTKKGEKSVKSLIKL